MAHAKADRPVAASIIAAALGAVLIGSASMTPAATRIARAQTEPATAANGMSLPPRDFDPVAARNEDLIESPAIPATPTPAAPPADGSTVPEAPAAATDASAPTTDAPAAATDGSENGNSVTTSLGGSDVAVSSVGGSHEVDRPKKRSDRRK